MSELQILEYGFKLHSSISILQKQAFRNLSILLLKQFQVIMSISHWCWQSISLVTNTFKSCKNVVLCLCLDIYVSIKSKTVIIFKENVYMVLIVMATKWQLNRTKPHLLYEDRGILIMQFSYFSWQRNLHKTPNLVTG